MFARRDAHARGHSPSFKRADLITKGQAEVLSNSPLNLESMDRMVRNQKPPFAASSGVFAAAATLLAGRSGNYADATRWPLIGLRKEVRRRPYSPIVEIRFNNPIYSCNYDL
jgi:hypothetical protein